MKKAVLAIFAAVLYSCGGPSEQQAPDEAQGIGGITEDISDIAVSAINDSITKTVTSGRFSMENSSRCGGMTRRVRDNVRRHDFRNTSRGL